MSNKNMTAMVSAFARAYHFEKKDQWIFRDPLAKNLLGKDSYDMIARQMALGIDFFNPNADLNSEEALSWIVDNYLSPSTLGRSSFSEKALANAVVLGAKQYLIMGSGYDSFAYRQADYGSDIQIFEIDQEAMITLKQNCLKENEIEIPQNTHFIPANLGQSTLSELLLKSNVFDQRAISFCSLLGLTYYLSKDTLDKLLGDLSGIFAKGSSLVFDYPDGDTFKACAGTRTKKQMLLAAKSGEPFQASYTYKAMEKLLESHGFLIYNHLTPVEVTQELFHKYNQSNDDQTITGFDNVNYCLAVKR